MSIVEMMEKRNSKKTPNEWMSENNLIFMFATNGAPDKSTHIRKELEILLLPLKVSDNFDETVLKCFQEIFFERTREL